MIPNEQLVEFLCQYRNVKVPCNDNARWANFIDLETQNP